MDTASPPPPDLAGSSIYNLSSAKTSPTTPSPHASDSRTTKTMTLGPDYGFSLSTVSQPPSNLNLRPSTMHWWPTRWLPRCTDSAAL